MALLRAPQWRRCLQQGAALQQLQRQQLSGSALVAKTPSDRDCQDIQDPSKTWTAYSSDKEGRQVPTEADEGVEREVVWGKNIPASAEQAKEELKYAGKGLAESVEQAAGVLLSKAKDAAAKAQRAVGLESDRPEMSEGTMGAAGKMEYAPPSSSTGAPASSLEHAREKYDEMSDTEKPNYPAGEQSVNEKFPEMARAAKEQSLTPEQQRAENEEIRRSLHKPS